MAACNYVIICKKTGNKCPFPKEDGYPFCQKHNQLNDSAEPPEKGKCIFVKKNLKRCTYKSAPNGFCGYHQPDTIGYKHMCGPESVCGCLPPGYFKQREIEEGRF